MNASSFLFLLWTLLAAAIWWRKLKSPVLFLAVTMLVGLGAQAVSGVLWAMWQASSNQFVSTSLDQARAAQIPYAVFHAVATFCVVAPICALLSKRL